jgi:hypothetical protein
VRWVPNQPTGKEQENYNSSVTLLKITGAKHFVAQLLWTEE